MIRPLTPEGIATQIKAQKLKQKVINYIYTLRLVNEGHVVGQLYRVLGELTATVCGGTTTEI